MWKILNGVEWKTPGHCNYRRIQLHRNLYSFFFSPGLMTINTISLSLSLSNTSALFLITPGTIPALAIGINEGFPP